MIAYRSEFLQVFSMIIDNALDAFIVSHIATPQIVIIFQQSIILKVWGWDSIFQR